MLRRMHSKTGRVIGTSVSLLTIGISAAFGQFGVVSLVNPHSDDIVVQAGDLFHVTAEQSGKSGKKLTVDLGDGRFGIEAGPGEAIPVVYETPGEYIIRSTLGRRKLKPLGVTVLDRDVPADALATTPTVALATTSASTASVAANVSVGSVYAKEGKFPVRMVASAPCFFQLVRYRHGVIWEGDIPAGDTVVVIDGPKDDEPIWTLIKFIDGAQRGGTHVLSSSTPYLLLIDNIRLARAATTKASVPGMVGGSSFGICVDDEATLEVVPNPSWAVSAPCEPLYKWSQDLSGEVGLSQTVSYATKGSRDIGVYCASDTAGAATTVHVLKIDLDGIEPNPPPNGAVADVPDDEEFTPGTIIQNGRTKLLIRDPGANVGSYKLSWRNISSGRKLNLNGTWPSAPGQTAPAPYERQIVGPCTAGWAKTFNATKVGNWALGQSITVTLSHSMVTCTDKVRLCRVKVYISPDSGPPGTKITATLAPAGSGLLSGSTTVSCTGKFHPTPASLGETTETTVSYPASKVHYDAASPDKIEVVAGDAMPPASFFTSNPQLALATGGQCDMEVTINTPQGPLTRPFIFTPIPEATLGTVSGGTFSQVTQFSIGQELRAQVLVKDDGLGTPPTSLTVTVQSYDDTGSEISSSPGDRADPSHSITVQKLTSGGTPGFHTYWSDAGAPIVPWPYDVMPTTHFAGRVFIYYVDGGKLEVEYAP